MILVNEVLYFDGAELLLKTIDVTRQHYGIYSTTRGLIAAPAFLHIFVFEKEGATAVAIDQQQNYVTIDINGKVGDIATEGEELHKHYLIKNNRCNCINLRTETSCNLCRGLQVIENSYVMNLHGWFWRRYDVD